MISIQIEKLQEEKTKTIVIPRDMIDNDDLDNSRKHKYIIDNHKDFYDRCIELWRKVGSITESKGHSKKTDSYKNKLGTLIYI